MPKFMEFLTELDMIGKCPQFYLAKNESYKTPIGGFISIFIRLGILFFLTFIIFETFIIKRGTINSESEIQLKLPIYNISTDDLQFYFILTDDTWKPQVVDFSKVDFKLITVLSAINNGSTNRTIVKKVDVTQCPKEVIEKAENTFYINAKRLLAENMIYCPNLVNDSFTIGGDFIYGHETYQTVIYFGPRCKTEGKCTREEIQGFYNYTQLVSGLFFVNGYKIAAPFDYDNPVKRVFEQTFINMTNTSITYNLEYSLTKMSLYDSVFPFVGYKEKKFFTFSNQYSSGEFKDSFSFNILVNHKIKAFSRYYNTIDFIVTKFFSIYLSCIYAGSIVLQFLHTYNMERFLINSTLINENSISSKYPNIKLRKLSGESKQKQLTEEVKDVEDNSSNSDPKLKEKILTKEQQQQNRRTISLDTNSIASGKISFSSNEDKLENLKQINDFISKAKVKMNLKNRYFCFSKTSKNFILYFDSLKEVLDIRNYIKLYLQFEKLKGLNFTENEKFVFETFNVNLDFLKNPTYNKNINDMTSEELCRISPALEELKNDENSRFGRKLYVLVNEELRKNI